MNLRRNEILTGTLVLVTFAVVLGVLLLLSAPGVLHPLNTYYVLFDNAGGIEPGTGVLLAGRHVGEVTDVQSPVPVSKRPEAGKHLEALVEIRVDEDAQIYRTVTVRMQQYGLLGQQMIDFAEGDESSGVAESGSTFVGERVAGLTEASGQAKKMLEEMERTLAGLNAMIGEGGELKQTAAYMKDFANTIRHEPWRLVRKATKEYPGEKTKEEKKKDEKKESDARRASRR